MGSTQGVKDRQILRHILDGEGYLISRGRTTVHSQFVVGRLERDAAFAVRLLARGTRTSIRSHPFDRRARHGGSDAAKPHCCAVQESRGCWGFRSLFESGRATPRYKQPVRLCSVSIDLDDIACYTAIHDLASAAPCHAVYDLALGRIREFAGGLALPLTLFVIARDLEREPNVALLRRAVSDGHEIGNHSLDHCYDLTKREAGEQRHQVVEANHRIEALLGVRPQGFRAPGYTMSDRLMGVLREAGFSYDSSVFPCPPYYAAKAAALLSMKLRGRVSKSVLDSPDVLRAPITPYRAGDPYWTRGGSLLELPIQVVGPLRLPFIGTSLTVLGPSGARLLTHGLVGLPFVNLELHGIDFLEADDVPKAVRAVQPDVRVPLERKLSALSAVVETLRSNGYAFQRLDEAAAMFARSVGEQ